MSASRGFRVLVLAAVLAGLPSSARAETPPSTTASTDLGNEEAKRAQAKARYEQAALAYKNDRFKDAIDLFLEADHLAPSAPLSFNIARSYEKIGDTSGALRWYRDYLRRDPNAKNSAEVQKIVRGFEAGLAKKGLQQITVLSSPPGATVTVDGRPVGVTPFTGEFPPGPHQFDFSLRGYGDIQRPFEVPPNEARDLTVHLEPRSEPVVSVSPTTTAIHATEPAAPPTDAAPPKPSGPKFGPWPWITLGAGAATLGGSVVFEVSRRRAESDAKSDPTQVGYSTKLDTMQSRQTTARILAGVGGALVVVGGVLLALDLGSSRGKEHVTLGLAVTPGTYGLALGGQLQ